MRRSLVTLTGLMLLRLALMVVQPPRTAHSSFTDPLSATPEDAEATQVARIYAA